MNDIAKASLAVFTRQGFRLTQMSDVAREAGVSAGALYSYVAGKEALLELALAEALGQAPATDEPFAARGFCELAPELGIALRSAITWPALTAACRRPALLPEDCDSVMMELFDLVARNRHLIWLLDRCAAEVPELAGLYQSAIRGRYIADFAAFVALAPGGGEARDRAAVARALMEMTVWMSMHRLRDRQPPDITDTQARAAVLRIARATLLTSC